LPKLLGAAEDATHLSESLAKVTKSSPDNFIVLSTNDISLRNGVTKGKIIGALEHLAEVSQSNDIVFIMFACHGIQLDKQPYICPSNAELDSHNVSSETCIPISKVNEYASKIKCRALIVSYDMCRREPLLTVAQANDIHNRDANLDAQQKSILLPVRAVPANVQPQTTTGEVAGQMTIFGCGPNQTSHEWGTKRRGIFSYYFEEALHQAADQNGVLKLGNLVDFVQTSVSAEVPKLTGGEEQTPYPAPDPEQIRELIIATGLPPGNGGKAALPATATSPGANDAFFRLGMEFFNKRDYSTAEKMFEEAFRASNDSSAMDAFWAGRCLGFEEKFQEEMKWMNLAVKLDPSLGMPHNNLGTLLDEAGLHEQAAAEYRECIRLAPKWPMAYNNVGRYYKDFAGNLPEAKKWYLAAIGIDSTYALPYNGIGQVYRLQAEQSDKPDYTLANSQFITAQQLNPTDYYAYQNLASVLEAKKKYIEAEQELLSGLSRCNSGELLLSLGELYEDHAELGKSAQADEVIKKAATLEPKPSLLEAVAWHFQGNENYDEAEKYARQGLAIEETAGLLNVLGCICWERWRPSDMGDVERLFLKAKGFAPGEAYIIRNLARFYAIRLGDYKKAAEQYVDLLSSSEHVASDFTDYAKLLRDKLNDKLKSWETLQRGFADGLTDEEFLETYAVEAYNAKRWSVFDAIEARYRSKTRQSICPHLPLGEAAQVVCFRHCLLAAPEEEDLYSGLSQLLFGSSADKVQLYRSATQANPMKDWAYLGLAESLIETKQYTSSEEAAIAGLGMSERVGPQPFLDLLVTAYKGLYPSVDGQMSKMAATKALAAYDLASKYSPGFKGELGRGALLVAIGNLRAAEACYDKAISRMELDSYSFSTICDCASLALNRNDLSKVDALDNKLSHVSQNARGDLWLALAATTPKRATTLAEKALAANARNRDAYSVLLKAYGGQADFSRIESLCEKAAEAGVDTSGWRASVAGGLDWNVTTARKLSERLFELEFVAFPKNVVAHIAYGHKLEAVGDFVHAQGQYEKGEFAFDNASGVVNVARLMGLEKKTREAESLFLRLAKRNSLAASDLLYKLTYISFLINERHDFKRANLHLSNFQISSKDLLNPRKLTAYSARREAIFGIVRGQLALWKLRSKDPGFEMIRPRIVEISRFVGESSVPRLIDLPLWKYPGLDALLNKRQYNVQ
jgi:tetratricopeptide (TPR) repeat protein